MAVNPDKKDVMAIISASNGGLSLPEIRANLTHDIPERTLRRWLSTWVKAGTLTKTGNRRSTRYHLTSVSPATFQFLAKFNASEKLAVLKQLRDLWTHSSTAVEGNTLTLGDTHRVLEYGLTISGKSLREHQEVIGHARAIELVYQSINTPLTPDRLFDLHKAVQTEHILDIYKPYGAWKIEPNGVYAITNSNSNSNSNEQVYIEYAQPADVPWLMKEYLAALNDVTALSMHDAPNIYAKLHAGFAHIHPFWDGNGRIARLVSNIPLLKSGLPPILIPQQQRQHYIELLADYEIASRQLNRQSGVWPRPELLSQFEEFITACYQTTLDLIAKFPSSNRA